MTESQTRTVSIDPQAAVTMIAHAVKHKHQTIHGLLLGKLSSTGIIVKDAAAVCHGSPTRPIVETAVGLIQDMTDDLIVGWYTAPALMEETKAGPVALRMAANLATEKVDPCLIVLNNKALVTCAMGESKADEVFAAFGKNLGEQWLDPLACSVHDSGTASSRVKEEIANGTPFFDFIDHLDEEPSTPWYPR